ncbi:hypothetical protein CBR_g8914 [Chara braunii]|uniref:Retinol dehydrogenase n=1 Tax=Chara braunii TaxID=69332 RepID=A0A388KNB9_CHABU|nr:hypothetical protein CBR_g8914 [Chara braunii]|eukprot:GBG71498.1 hypothetical protein CBR_g8914 [Chara braunii]
MASSSSSSGEKGHSSAQQQQQQLRGKTVIVTGSNCGIGLETAAELARRGASVILACRSVERANDAMEEIHRRQADADVMAMKLDLGSQSSVREFAKSFKALRKPLHVLVNNAGANFRSESRTEGGVGISAQVNFLGPYTLTRLLRDELVAGAPSKVVNVSSIMHRMGSIRDARAFLREPKQGRYDNCKLGNVLFTVELNKRWNKDGVEAAAVDPGAVNSNIWRNSAFSRPPLKWGLQLLFAPPSDGASAVIHAATTCPSEPHQRAHAAEPRPGDSSSDEDQDYRRNVAENTPVRLFAEGAFASKLVTGLPSSKWMSAAQPALYLAAAAVDWPVRMVTGKRVFGKVYEVQPNPAAYDASLTASLWECAAEMAGLPPNDE